MFNQMSNILCYTFHNDEWMTICKANGITNNTLDLAWLHIRVDCILDCILHEQLLNLNCEIRNKPKKIRHTEMN